jgi:phospholipid/cholesterol/gamma-HCH transport system substrate-binding protein
VTGLQQLVDDVNQGKGSLGKLTQTDALHNQLVDASKSLNLLIDDINKNPKKYVHFSVIGRKDAEGFSDTELEQIRSEINKLKVEEKKP